MITRRALEREAERLGIPWTSETTDEQLHALIASREDMVVPEPAVEMPGCYGLRWDGDRVDDCRGCGVKDSCLHRFATEYLPEMRKRLGSVSTVAAAANRLKVLPESLFAAIKYANKLKSSRAQTTTRSTADISQAFDAGVEDETRQVTEEPIVTMDQSPHAQTDTFPGEQVESSSPSVEGSPSPSPAGNLLDLEIEGTAKKKAPKKGVVSKKRAPKKKAQVTDRPPRAGSAQLKRASDPVTTTQPTTDCVTTATAPASQTRKWGDGPSRYRRERTRNPAIASLAKGSMLVREYKGTLYHTEVLRDRYRLVELGTEHPTLYDIMKTITGLHLRKGRMLANWSVPKFWRTALKQALHGQEKTLPPKKPNDKFRKRKERAAAKQVRQSKKKKAKKLARPKSDS